MGPNYAVPEPLVKTMLLDAQELLELVHGDAEPERLADLLDRLDRCPDSAEGLKVLVTLRAHREEALESLRMAADEQSAPVTQFPHPAARTASNGWAVQGLRLAASVALAATIGLWAMSSPIVSTTPPSPDEPMGFAALATNVPVNSVRTGPRIQATARSDSDPFETARRYIAEEGRFAEALEILADADENDPRTHVFRGMAQYFLQDYISAARTLRRLRHEDEEFVWRQAVWYEANALLRLENSWLALALLDELSNNPTGVFYAEAGALRDTVAARVGRELPATR